MKYSILLLNLLLSIINYAQKPSKYDSIVIIPNNHTIAIDDPTKYRIIEIVGDAFEDSVLKNLVLFNQIHTIRIMGMRKVHLIPQFLTISKHLKTIEISYCSYINYDSFFMSIPCQAIEILSITHSQITKIPPIQRMRKLKTLILDSNNICEWDAFIFEMNSIEMLSIHSNKLKNIPSSIKLLKNLNILILYNNPIFTHKSKQYVQAFVSDLQATKIKKLNIATTDLHFFPNNLDELKSLAFVNLSNNPIKNISKQCFKHIVAISLEGTKVKYNKRLFNKLSPALP